MRKELITIVIPVYKVEKYIDRCIPSILNQTYKNLEIILVDDGSPDNCGKMCDEYAKKDKRIKVIHKENGGLSDARNVGIECAKGKYISFVDSDDWLPSNSIEFLYKAIKTTNSEISSGKIKEVFKFIDENSENDKIGKINTYDTVNALEKLMYLHDFSNSASAKLYLTSLFDNIKYPKGRLYEDLDTTYKLFSITKKVAMVNNIVYYYFQHDSSIMHQKFSHRRYEALESVDNEYEFIKRKFPELIDAAQFRKFYEYISILNDLPIYYKDINRIYFSIKKMRRKILNNKKLYLKQKFLCFATYYGRIGIKISFVIKNLIKKIKEW